MTWSCSVAQFDSMVHTLRYKVMVGKWKVARALRCKGARVVPTRSACGSGSGSQDLESPFTFLAAAVWDKPRSAGVRLGQDRLRACLRPYETNAKRTISLSAGLLTRSNQETAGLRHTAATRADKPANRTKR